MRFKTSKLLRESETKTNETHGRSERERERERDGDANFDDGVFPTNDDDVPEFFDEKRE